MTDDILERTLCVQFTEFPGVDEAWLEEKVRAIRKALFDRLGKKVEWVKWSPCRNAVGSASLS